MTRIYLENVYKILKKFVQKMLMNNLGIILMI